MSIHKVDGEYVCECDDCGEEGYGGTVEDFREFVEQIKADGWRIRKDGDTWVHTCPVCSEGA